MSEIIIIHGTGGSPERNWFPWLAAELRKRGHTAKVPRMPTPQGQSLEGWFTAFAEVVGDCTSDTVLIGHSLGAAFILRLLERLSTPIRGSLFVAGFLGELGLPEFDTLNASFVRSPFRWGEIRRNRGFARVYHGDDDPYVPLSQAQELSREIGAALVQIPGGRHLNAEGGYTKFELLLNDLVLLLAREERSP